MNYMSNLDFESFTRSDSDLAKSNSTQSILTPSCHLLLLLLKIRILIAKLIYKMHDSTYF